MTFQVLSRNYVFYCNFLAIVLVAVVSQFILVPVLLQMLLYTYPTIFVAAHISLKQTLVDDKTGKKIHQTDSVGKNEAMLFPILGSCALVTLYLLYKYLSPYWINLLLSGYLTLTGVVAVGETVHIFFEPCLNVVFRNQKIYHVKLTFFPFGSKTEPLEINFGNSKIVTYMIGVISGFYLLYTKHFLLHNLFAVCFSIQAISLISVGNFKIAAGLLGGLLVYDIFWVFCTEVMVSVAKSFEGPAKILFPVSLDPLKFSLLGLGDVVLPGIFIAMCLRFDHSLNVQNYTFNSTGRNNIDTTAAKKENNRARRDINHGDKTTQGDVDDSNKTKPTMSCLTRLAAYSNMDIIDKYRNFSKFYFHSTLMAYELGLITTSIVLTIFQHPQPALLYLVPYCLISFFGTCALNGQLREALEYSEDNSEVEVEVISQETDKTK